MPSEVIISIRPEYAEAILTGVKTVELRRRIPSIDAGTRLWIYSTLPVGAVVGTAIVSDIVRGTPTAIWNDWAGQTGVTRRAFREYFSGAREAVALVVSKPKRVEHVTIDELRQMRTGFHPPQVMVHLSAEETRSLRVLGKMAA